MVGTEFNDVNLSETVFFNINLRGAKLGGIDFGGAAFSCMNTGEGKPKKPAHFENMEFDDCEFKKCSFEGVTIINSKLEGMKIDGISVLEMIRIYKKYRNSK